MACHVNSIFYPRITELVTTTPYRARTMNVVYGQPVLTTNNHNLTCRNTYNIKTVNSFNYHLSNVTDAAFVHTRNHSVAPNSHKDTD